MTRRHPHALPERIGSSIEAAAPRGTGDLHRVVDAWVAIVGSEMAAHAMPARRRQDGTVVIHATDASWHQAVDFERRRLLTALRERLGEESIAELKVEIGPVTTRPTERPAEGIAPTQAEPGPRARALTDGVADPRLRAALAAVIEHTSERGKTRS